MSAILWHTLSQNRPLGTGDFPPSESLPGEPLKSHILDFCPVLIHTVQKLHKHLVIPIFDAPDRNITECLTVSKELKYQACIESVQRNLINIALFEQGLWRQPCCQGIRKLLFPKCILNCAFLLHRGCRHGRSSSRWDCGALLGLGKQAASMGLPGGNGPVSPEEWPSCCASGGPPQSPLWTRSSMTHKLSTSDHFIRSHSGHLRAGSLAAASSLHAVSKGSLSSVFCSTVQTLASPAEVLTASLTLGKWDTLH